MTSPIPYLLYFLGPIVLFLLLRKRLGGGWMAFLIGFPLFTLSQLGIGLIAALCLLVTKPFFPDIAVEWTVAIVGFLSAGLCEESCRYLGFWWMRRRGRTIHWGRGIVYAIGHSGMETWVVGGMMVGIAVALSYFSDQLPAEALTKLEPMRELGGGMATFLAIERLIGGLAIHACFTSLVVLCFLRNDKRWLLAAMVAHASNNAIATSLQGYMASSTLFHVGYFCTLLVVTAIALWFLAHSCREAADRDPAVAS
jgi:uncharacterized membrane protein YhfC